MCTVTFIPYKENIFITSSRDEKDQRPRAIPPQSYDFPSGKICFPKDGHAGGTWFALHENGNALVLLNGGFKFHLSKPPYRQSRGLVVLDLIGHESPFNLFRSIGLDDIEPFTLVAWEDESLFECRWDGEKKYAKRLDEKTPHIWSSATLYEDAVSEKKENWFREWLARNTKYSKDSIIEFHRFTDENESYGDLDLKRDSEVSTVSIAALELSGLHGHITYLDMLDNKTYLQDIEFKKEWAGR